MNSNTQKYITSKHFAIKENDLGYVNKESELFSINVKAFNKDLSISFFKSDILEKKENALILRIKLYKKDNTTLRIFKATYKDDQNVDGYLTYELTSEEVLKAFVENGIEEVTVAKKEFIKLDQF